MGAGKALGVAVCLMWLAFGVACGKAPVEQQEPAGAPRRIVSLSPSVTEIIHGLGAFDRLVAVSTYCTFPPEVERLPKVGNWLSINLEQMSSLRPDLVIVTEAQAQFQEERLKALGIRTHVAPSQTVNDALEAIESVARAIGEEERGRQLASETRASLDETKRRTRGLPQPKVLCIVDRVPGTLRELYTATKGSFIAELLEIAGGRSIAPLAGTGYGKITKEAVLALDPDLIIDMEMGTTGSLGEDAAAAWQELSQLRAVREGRVHAVRDPTLLHPSQFVARSARLFAQIIHPEVFARDVPR
jgi:iron complex transport system substrate-binding protein